MTKKYVRKLQKVGDYTYTVSIPKEIIDDLKWQERQKVEITFDDNKKSLSLKDWKK